MERTDWSRVAHRGIDLMNPLPAAKLDEVLDVLDLAAGARVLDLGCGKAEVLIRIAERRAVQGIGVDRAPELLAAGREAAARRVPDVALELVEGDLTTYVPVEPFDLAVAVGASADGFDAMLRRLAGLVRPGGLALLGEGYWRREPDAAYLEALGAARDELPTYAGLFAAAAAHALEPRYAVTASVDDFDRYEWRWSLNGERYAAAHPDEPGVAEFLAWIRNGRRRYVELGGRETLGFGLFLLERTR
jgi:SAM-dependent methyltransferase